MAFSAEYDPHIMKIDSAISSLNNVSEKLESILESIQMSINDGHKKPLKIIGAIKPVLDTIKKYVANLNLLHLNNNAWRKSLVIEISNYYSQQQDKLVVTKYPTQSIPLQNAKWPPESSSEIDNHNCNE